MGQAVTMCGAAAVTGECRGTTSMVRTRVHKREMHCQYCKDCQHNLSTRALPQTISSLPYAGTHSIILMCACCCGVICVMWNWPLFERKCLTSYKELVQPLSDLPWLADLTILILLITSQWTRTYKAKKSFFHILMRTWSFVSLGCTCITSTCTFPCCPQSNEIFQMTTFLLKRTSVCDNISNDTIWLALQRFFCHWEKK